MKELAYETTDKQKKGFCSGLYHYILTDFNNGSECDTGSENVITLAIHFCKVMAVFQ